MLMEFRTNKAEGTAKDLRCLASAEDMPKTKLSLISKTLIKHTPDFLLMEQFKYKTKWSFVLFSDLIPTRFLKIPQTATIKG